MDDREIQKEQLLELELVQCRQRLEAHQTTQAEKWTRFDAERTSLETQILKEQKSHLAAVHQLENKYGHWHVDPGEQEMNKLLREQSSAFKARQSERARKAK